MRKFITDIAILLERGELSIHTTRRWDAGFRSQITTVMVEDSYKYYIIRDKKGQWICGISSGMFFPKITTESHNDESIACISWTEYYRLKRFAEDVAENSSFGDKISKMVEQSNSEMMKKL